MRFEVDYLDSELHGRRHAGSAHDPPSVWANYRPVHTNPPETQKPKISRARQPLSWALPNRDVIVPVRHSVASAVKRSA